MYRHGYVNISNMDISRVVLEKMRDHYMKNAKKEEPQGATP
jgi:hypothetical protein